MFDQLLRRVPLLAVIPLVFTFTSHGFTALDAEKATQSLRAVYWHPAQKYFSRYETRSDILDFWMYAHVWETVMDAWERTGKQSYRTLIDDTYDGFVSIWIGYLGGWEKNEYADDLMWWALACTHAYRLTDDTRYLEQARYLFDFIWTTYHDDVLDGGIYWRYDRQVKNACVTSPGVITACNLFEQLGDSTYLQKGLALYDWMHGHLWDTTSGAVWDHQNINGTVNKGTSTYNQGTFIGAGVRLFQITGDSTYLEHACKTTDYTRARMCNDAGILRNEGQGDFGTFKLICVRYIMALIREGGQSQYLQWMYDNANTVWANRKPSNNLMGYDWANPIPPDTVIQSQTAAGGVCLMNLLTPEDQDPPARSPYDTIEAELYDVIQPGMITEEYAPGKSNLGSIKADFYTAYFNYDFGSRGDSLTFTVSASSATAGGRIEIRLADPDGPLAGTCEIAGNGSWNSFVPSTARIAPIQGVHNLFMVYRGDSYLFNIDWFHFGPPPVNIVAGPHTRQPRLSIDAAQPDAGSSWECFSVTGRGGFTTRDLRKAARGVYIVRERSRNGKTVRPALMIR